MPLPTNIDPADLLKRNDIASLYTDLGDTWRRYDLIDRYMRGDHELKFATAKFTNAFGGLFRAFADNYCKRVVQTLGDYIQLDHVETASKEQQAALDSWFEAQRTAYQSGRVHGDAFAYGAGYAILAPDSANKLRMYRQDVRAMRVLYDDENPDKLVAAIKVWQQADKSWRLNVYTDAGTYRYATLSKNGGGASSSPGMTTPPSDSAGGTPSTNTRSSLSPLPTSIGAFYPVQDTDFVKAPVAGMVPVFHFANEADSRGQGVTELQDIIPLQDALNKSIVDLLVAMEFQSYRQRYVTGIEVPRDEDTGQPVQPVNHGVDRLWAFEGAETKVGEFSAIDLEQFLKVSESFRVEIARIARIPVHQLFMSDNFPSGEALKVAEQPLLAKVRDRQLAWGNSWEDMGRYALAFMGGGSAGDDQLTARWTDVSPRSAKEQADGDLAETQAAAAKIDIGVSPQQALRELDYTDEQIAKFPVEVAQWKVLNPDAPTIPPTDIQPEPIKV